jgi:hypothetical protein
MANIQLPQMENDTENELDLEEASEYDSDVEDE